nr:uncharacterized protein LOC128695743 isoform X2 [Cherax quadricarinatus]
MTQCFGVTHIKLRSLSERGLCVSNRQAWLISSYIGESTYIMEKEDKKRIYANYMEALAKRRLSIEKRRLLEIKRGGVHRDERLSELQNEWDRINVLWKKAVETGNTPDTVVNETESNDAQLGGATGNEDESAGSSASVGTSERGGAVRDAGTSVPINEDDERATTSHAVSDSNVAHNSGGEDERATTSRDERPEIITYIQNFRGRHTVRVKNVFTCL